jgi:catechol 2,3-dioxygenase-like lactoylglutathione lyase family enzyme
MDMTDPVIRGVNHIGITVPDIEAAKSFLAEALGGRVIYQSFGPQDPPRQGPEFERAVGAFPGTVVRAQAMVKIGNGPDIELFEMHGPEQAQPVRASDLGITHFGVYTDDIHGSVERFQNAGGTAPCSCRCVLIRLPSCARTCPAAASCAVPTSSTSRTAATLK